MIVAFPTDRDNGLESNISKRFGVAKYFVLVDISEGSISRVDVLPVLPPAFGALPQFLSELGVKVVVCDGIGDKPREMLDLQGIILFSNKSGKVSSLLSQLMPDFEEIERQEKEELERREKARKALEKMRERNASFWAGQSSDGFVLLAQMDQGVLVISALSGLEKVCIAKLVVNSEDDEDKTDVSLEFYHFYGSRITKKENKQFSIKGDLVIFGDEKFSVIWDDVLSDDLKYELRDLVIKSCTDDPKKEDIRQFNDRVKQLIEQYSIRLDH